MIGWNPWKSCGMALFKAFKTLSNTSFGRTNLKCGGSATLVHLNSSLQVGRLRRCPAVHDAFAPTSGKICSAVNSALPCWPFGGSTENALEPVDDVVEAFDISQPWQSFHVAVEVTQTKTPILLSALSWDTSTQLQAMPWDPCLPMQDASLTFLKTEPQAL